MGAASVDSVPMTASRATGDRLRRRAVRRIEAAALAAVLMLASGCGGTADGTAPEREVVVMAASSLSDVIEIVFEGRDSVTPVLAGSSTLVAQLAAGAEADVLITANAHHHGASRLRRVGPGRAHPDRDQHPRARHPGPLVGNPGGVTGLADLASGDLLIGLCAVEVPCGALAEQALGDAQITPSADTLEPNVRALAAKISLGELDAGLVYATDARMAELATVDAPELRDHRTGYYIASVSAEPPPEVQAVIDDFTVLGSVGSKALYQYGFEGSTSRPVLPAPT